MRDDERMEVNCEGDSTCTIFDILMRADPAAKTQMRWTSDVEIVPSKHSVVRFLGGVEILSGPDTEMMVGLCLRRPRNQTTPS